jgi:hypothetical protein
VLADEVSVTGSGYGPIETPASVDATSLQRESAGSDIEM